MMRRVPRHCQTFLPMRQHRRLWMFPTRPQRCLRRRPRHHPSVPHCPRPTNNFGSVIRFKLGAEFFSITAYFVRRCSSRSRHCSHCSRSNLRQLRPTNRTSPMRSTRVDHDFHCRIGGSGRWQAGARRQPEPGPIDRPDRLGRFAAVGQLDAKREHHAPFAGGVVAEHSRP